MTAKHFIQPAENPTPSEWTEANQRDLKDILTTIKAGESWAEKKKLSLHEDVLNELTTIPLNQITCVKKVADGLRVTVRHFVNEYEPQTPDGDRIDPMASFDPREVWKTTDLLAPAKWVERAVVKHPKIKVKNIDLEKRPDLRSRLIQRLRELNRPPMPEDPPDEASTEEWAAWIIANVKLKSADTGRLYADPAMLRPDGEESWRQFLKAWPIDGRDGARSLWALLEELFRQDWSITLELLHGNAAECLAMGAEEKEARHDALSEALAFLREQRNDPDLKPATIKELGETIQALEQAVGDHAIQRPIKAKTESWRGLIERYRSGDPEEMEVDPYRPLWSHLYNLFYEDYPARFTWFADQCLAAVRELKAIDAGGGEAQALREALFQMFDVACSWYCSTDKPTHPVAIQEKVGEAVRAMHATLGLPDIISLSSPPLNFIGTDGNPVDVADALLAEDIAKGIQLSEPLPPGVAIDPRLIGLVNKYRDEHDRQIEEIRRCTKPYTPEREERKRQAEEGLKRHIQDIARFREKMNAEHEKEMRQHTESQAELVRAIQISLKSAEVPVGAESVGVTAQSEPIPPQAQVPVKKGKPGRKPKDDKFEVMHAYFLSGEPLTKKQWGVRWKYKTKKSCITTYRKMCKQREKDPAL